MFITYFSNLSNKRCLVNAKIYTENLILKIMIRTLTKRTNKLTKCIRDLLPFKRRNYCNGYVIKFLN